MKSLPTRERGLKVSQFPKSIHFIRVAPYAGAWIERSIHIGLVKPVFLSLPTRERGLKAIINFEYFDSVRVAPYAGAWIERCSVLV